MLYNDTEQKVVKGIDWAEASDEELDEMLNCPKNMKDSDSGYSTTVEAEEEFKHFCYNEPKWENKNLEKFLNLVERSVVSMGCKLLTQSMLNRKDFYSYHLIPHAINAIVFNSYACGYNDYILYNTIEDIVNIIKESKKISKFVSKYITNPYNYILGIIKKIVSKGEYIFSKENITTVIIKALETIVDMINAITSTISIVIIKPITTIVKKITTCMTTSIKNVFSWFN